MAKKKNAKVAVEAEIKEYYVTLHLEGGSTLYLENVTDFNMQSDKETGIPVEYSIKWSSPEHSRLRYLNITKVIAVEIEEMKKSEE